MTAERSPPPRSAVLFANSGARQGEAARAAVKALEERGVAVRRAEAGDVEDLARTLKRNAGTIDCAVVCGGDGSLRRAAAGLCESGLPLGIVPLGTANDLARTFDIPLDPRAAVEVMLSGWRRRIDLGSVNGHYFFNVASIGIGTDHARALSSDLKRRWGKLGYAIAAARVLSRARRFSAWVDERGTTLRTRTLQIAVGNGRFYGGGTVIAESAAIDDGHLDLYSLEMRQVWKLALMLPSLRAGAHGAWSEVTTARGTAFEIRTRRARPVNADGDIITETPAVFRVHPGAVTVLVPPPALGD